MRCRLRHFNMDDPCQSCHVARIAQHPTSPHLRRKIETRTRRNLSIFTLGRTLLQLRNKELKQKELEEEEKELQKRNKIVEQNELHAQMVSTVEEEIKAIESECAVLKVIF